MDKTCRWEHSFLLLEQILKQIRGETNNGEDDKNVEGNEFSNND